MEQEETPDQFFAQTLGPAQAPRHVVETIEETQHENNMLFFRTQEQRLDALTKEVRDAKKGGIIFYIGLALAIAILAFK